MSWLASFVIAVLTGALGLVCGAIVAGACVSWYRISSFEGGSGYFMVSIALLAGIAGFIIGLVAARVVAGGAHPGFLRGLGLSSAITTGIAGLTALIAWLLADIPPTIDGDHLDLAVEIRLPVGDSVPPASDSTKANLRLGSVVNHRMRKSQTGELAIAEARFEQGRWTIPGSVFLFTTRGLRSIDAEVGGKSVAGFIVPLPARPGKEYEQWSEWGPRPRPGSPPWPDTMSSYRFRVVRQAPPPPPPDPEVAEAERFAAVEPDAPLEEWLDFLAGNAPEERVTTIMKVVEERQAELAVAIRSDDERLRELALAAVVDLPTVMHAVADAVRAEGDSVANEIRRFNEMPASDPRFYDVQLELRSRFSSWHRAWWTVHQRTGVDGRPPVQEILELAQVRAKETSMDEIVINARAHLDGLVKKTP